MIGNGRLYAHITVVVGCVAVCVCVCVCVCMCYSVYVCVCEVALYSSGYSRLPKSFPNFGGVLG